jgi:deoxyribodipyrimidine photo-lyase
MKKEVSLCWFRRDLRLFDNNALFNALTGKYPVLPIFIFDPDILEKLSDKKDKRVAYIHQTLEHINEILMYYMKMSKRHSICSLKNILLRRFM